jgi:uncharacterized protein
MSKGFTMLLSYTAGKLIGNGNMSEVVSFAAAAGSRVRFVDSLDVQLTEDRRLEWESRSAGHARGVAHGAKEDGEGGTTMTGPSKLLMIFVDETDTWNEMPLYEAIVRRLVQLEVGGATVSAGIMGFGSHHKVHHKRLFGVSDDRPITISVVESEARIRSILPTIRAMIPAALVLLADVETV